MILKVNHLPFSFIPISSKMFSFLSGRKACKINVRNFYPGALWHFSIMRVVFFYTFQCVGIYKRYFQKLLNAISHIYSSMGLVYFKPLHAFYRNCVSILVYQEEKKIIKSSLLAVLFYLKSFSFLSHNYRCFKRKHLGFVPWITSLDIFLSIEWWCMKWKLLPKYYY